jgi:hypothetical protein
MKKVFTIFSIVVLVAISSCGGKSMEEQAAADSIAAAAAADSIAAAEAADGVILIVSYELFKNDGYNGSFQQFKKLLAQNPDALNDMYTLYSNRKGYTGDLRSYLNLIGIEPEASPEELRTLYDVLYYEGKITKTYEEFTAQWKEEAGYKEKVSDLVYRDNLYWSERDVFFQKYLGKTSIVIKNEREAIEQKAIQQILLSTDDLYRLSAFILVLFSIIFMIYIRKRVKAFFVNRKIQDYFLLFIAIPSLVFGLFLLVSSILKFYFQDYSRNNEILLGVLIFFIGTLFLLSLHKRKFVDFILFFISLGGLSFSILLLNSHSSDKEVSPFFLIPSVFILFILWKDNFFTKEPRNKTPEEIREKGKRMLDELREMGPDESMVGKIVVKKASVKKEEDKN